MGFMDERVISDSNGNKLSDKLKQLHTHTNKNTLDKLTDNGSQLLFNDSPVIGGSGGGDMLKSTYDKDDDGKIDAAKSADIVNWSGVQDKPSFATVAISGNYNDLSNKPDIPTSLSELEDNSTHRTVTDDQISTWDAKGKGNVTSVNNVKPDENGNVTISVGQMYLSGASVERPIAPAIGTPFFDTTLNKPIWYKGSNSWVDSTGTTVAPPSDTVAPNPVTNLTVGTITANSVAWTLSTSSDVEKYEVAYSSNNGSTYTVSSNAINSSSVTFTVNGLTPSTAYIFRVITIDTSGNRSTPVTITGTTITGTPTPIVSDDFNRADSTTSAGTTSSGKTWNKIGTTNALGISTNRLYAPTSGAGASYVDAGISDVRMEVTVDTLGNGHDFYFRVDSGAHYYRYAYNTTGWYLQESLGSFTTIASFTGTVLKSGDIVAIEVQGNTSKLYVNNNLIRTDTLLDLLTNTGFGLGFSGTPLGYADNFNIYPMGAAPSTGGTDTGGDSTNVTLTPKPVSYLSVADYGASGVSSSDVTTNIQNCINAASSQGKAVVIPAGTYWINPATGLNIPSNTTIWFDQGAVVKALGTSNATYFMFKIWNVSNVKIIGYPTLVGDKALHTGTGGESGMGFGLANTSSILIENANVSNCWGDGIYIGDNGVGNPYNKDVTVLNSTFDANRRQGMSVISAINLTVKNSKFTNTTGNAAGPCAGVDFEPNKINQLFQNVNFDNCSFTGNQGHGVWGDFYYMNGGTNPISINITNSTITGNLGQIYGTPGVQSQIATRSTVAGYVKVNGSYIYNK